MATVDWCTNWWVDIWDGCGYSIRVYRLFIHHDVSVLVDGLDWLILEVFLGELDRVVEDLHSFTFPVFGHFPGPCRT